MDGGMTFTDIMGVVGNTGVSIVLLIMFVFYVLKKAQTDDKRVADAQEASRKIPVPYRAESKLSWNQLYEGSGSGGICHKDPCDPPA